MVRSDKSTRQIDKLSDHAEENTKKGTFLICYSHPPFICLPKRRDGVSTSCSCCVGSSPT